MGGGEWGINSHNDILFSFLYKMKIPIFTNEKQNQNEAFHTGQLWGTKAAATTTTSIREKKRIRTSLENEK